MEICTIYTEKLRKALYKKSRVKFEFRVFCTDKQKKRLSLGLQIILLLRGMRGQSKSAYIAGIISIQTRRFRQELSCVIMMHFLKIITLIDFSEKAGSLITVTLANLSESAEENSRH